MKQITFIHAADLHLDSPMTGLSYLPKAIFEMLKESTFIALKQLTDAAIEHKVDFVILAGDLFDEEDRSVRAQTRLRKEMNRLNEHNIQVYIVHGNHDSLNGSWIHLEMPENVHIFSDKVEVKEFKKGNSHVHLYGFSYPSRHVMESMISSYVKQEGADFDIGILHGHGEGSSEHSMYAPFSVKELVEKKFDYWALGHIHKREILHEHPYVVYPGNTQGRNIKETGSKGCYLVRLTPGQTKLDFIETCAVEWGRVEIDGQSAANFHDLYQLCLIELEENRRLGKNILLKITLKNVNLTGREMIPIKNGELLQALQEEAEGDLDFVWPADIEVEQSFVWDTNQMERESDFYQELFKIVEKVDPFTEGGTRTLYDHPGARRFLPAFSEDEKVQLQQKALDKLIGMLHEE